MLLGARGIATRNKGIATRNKKLLGALLGARTLQGAQGIATY